LAFGNVDLHAIAWLLLGSVPGILIGSQLTVGIADRTLRIAFSCVLVLSGFKLLSPLPDVWTNRVIGGALVVAAVGFGLLALSWRKERRRSERESGLVEEVSPP
ncbi:MAG: hypothetical protein ACXVZW_11935, partial [Gaiellaceae bacterium]